jgi:1-acyl-sn-glycerol-3-phosphate acyltransferase
MSHAWMPTSPCGPDCITSGEPTVGRLRVAGRCLRAAGVLLGGVGASVVMPVAGRRGRERIARWFFQALLRAFGVKLAVSGASRMRPPRGALVVNNHISWLDIVAINAVQPMKAQAKSEVRSWPVIGRLANAAGTVYVDRERLRKLPEAVAELAEAMRGGSMVNATPEGTSWCGLASGRFRAAPFQAAIDAGVPVIPIAFRFRMTGGRETTAPAFIGDETLLNSIGRVARLRGLVMEAHVLPELVPVPGMTRRELAALTEAAVNSALGRVQVPSQRRQRLPVDDVRPKVSPH